MFLSSFLLRAKRVTAVKVQHRLMKVSAIILVITDIISLSLSLVESFISLLNQRWPRSYSYLVIKDLWSISYEHTLIDLKEETLKGVQCETHRFDRIFYRAIIFMVMALSHSLPTAHLSCCSNGYFYNLYTVQARLCIFPPVQWIQSFIKQTLQNQITCFLGWRWAGTALVALSLSFMVLENLELLLNSHFQL